MLKVMIAEDDLLTADVLEDILLGNGYEVCGVARTVAEAVTLGQHCKPDLALLDVRLANGGLGTEIAARLGFSGRPGILYATGNGNQIQLTTADGEAVLEKPYRSEDVVRALQIVEQIVTTGKASPPFPGGFQVLPMAHHREPAPAANNRRGPESIPRLLAQQAAFLSFAGFAYGESDLGRMLNNAARACAEMMGVTFCRIWRYRPEQNDLLMEAGAGWPQGLMQPAIPLADADSVQARAFATGTPTRCDLSKDKELVFSADCADHGMVSTLMVLVMSREGRKWGLLEIGDHSPHEYMDYDMEFMTGFADVLSEVVSPTTRRNAALQRKIEGMSDFMVARLQISADQQRATAARKLALDERLAVTQELQHRVRNNLQVVYGMLIGQLRTATEPSVKEGIGAISRCVITLGRVYDHLIGSGIGEKIDFGSYLSSLCSSFAEMEDPLQPRVGLTCQPTKVMLDLDTVTALGLIVAEFISNSYLHAFPEGKGTISVSLLVDRVRNEGTIVFADDGVGFDDIAGDKRAGLGMVRRLVKQISGSVDHQSGAGSLWTLRFPLPVGATNDDESAGDTAPLVRLLGSDLTVLDQAALERTAKLLKPGAIVTHLRALEEKCATLLHGLRVPGAGTDVSSTTLADTAHQLAGNCGMLGFERLAYVARHFEDAARIAPAQAAALTDDMVAALEATIKEIDARTHA